MISIGMRRFLLPVLASTVLGAVVIAAACSTPTEPKKEEPTFAPGEYGGEPLPGTEHITIVEPSPSVDRFGSFADERPGIRLIHDFSFGLLIGTGRTHASSASTPKT